MAVSSFLWQELEGSCGSSLDVALSLRKYASALLWTACLSPQISYVETLIPNEMVFESGPLEVITFR